MKRRLEKKFCESFCVFIVNQSLKSAAKFIIYIFLVFTKSHDPNNVSMAK